MQFLGTFITIIMVIAVYSTADADIYRLETDDELFSFTDSPSDSRYTLIMRDQPAKTPKTRRKPAAPVPQASRSANIEQDQPGLSSSGLPLQGIITSRTGLRLDPFDGRLRHHKGMDIAAPAGTPVKPVAPGTVIFSGWRSGYGNTVMVDHNNGMITVYAHHASNQVEEGSIVDSTTIIALSGSTGRSTGPHLHFEAWREGENITHTFTPSGNTARQPQITAGAPIRRYLQEDGTILFTNLR